MFLVFAIPQRIVLSELLEDALQVAFLAEVVASFHLKRLLLETCVVLRYVIEQSFEHFKILLTAKQFRDLVSSYFKVFVSLQLLFLGLLMILDRPFHLKDSVLVLRLIGLF